MARLSTEYYRDKSESSNSMGKRFSSLFKARKSLEDSSTSTNANESNKLLKPGFEKHAKRPSITLRPSTAPLGEVKTIPHGLDTNLEPAATKTTPTSTTEFERSAPLWVQADKGLIQGKKDGDDGGLQGIQEEVSTGASDPSASNGTRNLATLDTIAHTPTVNKALRVLGNPQSVEAVESPAKIDKLDVSVKPADSVSNGPIMEEESIKADVEGPRRESSVRTTSSWATATGPNSADAAERLGLIEASLQTPGAPRADATSTVRSAVSLIFPALCLVLTITLGFNKALLLIFLALIISTPLYAVMDKLFESEAGVTHPVCDIIAQGSWTCAPVVHWVAFHTGYLVSPIVEAIVKGFTTGYERALLDH